MSDISLSDAKPCPFCGGTKIMWARLMWERHLHNWMVVCCNFDCSAEGPADLGQSGALDKWNKRAEANAKGQKE